MTRPRSEQICLDATTYYHCTTRCVRKAFLCGKTKNKSFEHRRAWIESQLIEKSQYFMIDIVSYAVMHNHYHVIVSIDKPGAQSLTDKEVVHRWHNLYNGNELSQAFINDDTLNYEQQLIMRSLIRKWRERLYSLSWFMRSINEPISRWANKEDNCKGRFWEGRFKSQALLDDKALFACMAYVDLNPIRANIAKNLEDSNYTSIKYHLNSNNYKNRTSVNTLEILDYDKTIMPFKDQINDNQYRSLPINFSDYLELVEWSGRQMLSPGKGFISDPIPHLLRDIKIDWESWCYLSQNFEVPFKLFVGTLLSLKPIREHFNMKRIGGRPACLKFLGPD